MILLGGVLRPPGGSWDAADKYQVVIPVHINKETTNLQDSLSNQRTSEFSSPYKIRIDREIEKSVYVYVQVHIYLLYCAMFRHN